MRKFFKIVLYVIGSILLLLILVIILLQTPWGKNFVRRQAVSFLEKKLKTRVVIQRLDYSLPKMISLEGVLFIDRRNDTLLSMNLLKVDLDMLALVRSKVSVNQLILDGVNAHIYRNLPDTVFNYNYIIEAFAAVDTTTTDIKEKDTSATAMVYDINKVQLKNIRLRYDDETGGTYFSLNLNELVLRPRKIDPDKMLFEVKEFTINGLQSSFASDTSHIPPPPPDTTRTDFNLVVDKLQLERIAFAFDGRMDSTHFDITAGTLRGKLDNFNLVKELVAVSNLQLENVQSRFIMGKTGKKAPLQTEAPTDTAASLWYVTVKDIMLKEVNFGYDDNNVPRQQAGMDYSHLDIRNFSLTGQDVLYSADTISGNLKHLALNEKSGLNLQELRTEFLYHGKGAALKNLYMLTPGTLIQDNIEVTYPSLAALEKEMHKMKVNLNFIKSKVSIKDLLIFMTPDNRKMLLPYEGQQLLLAGNIQGYLNALQIKGLYLSGLNNTEIALDGRLNGLPDADRLKYDFQIKKLQSGYKDIEPFLPDSLKQQIRVPDLFSINGKLAGTKLDYQPDVHITTSDGNADIKGYIYMSPGEGREKYDLFVKTESLNAGRIMRMDTLLGKVSMDATVRGTSFDVQKMNAEFQANIQSAWAMGYDYNSISLNGTFAEKIAYLKMVSADPNALLNLEANADISRQYPSVKADLNIDNLDLQALKLYNDTLQLKGIMNADFSSLNPDYPAGTFTWAQPAITISQKPMLLDSIYLRSEPTADSSQHIFLNLSNILTANLTGHIPLTQSGNAILARINKYYKLSDTISTTLPQYDMNLAVAANYHPLLKELTPDLKPFDTIHIAASLSPETMKLVAYAPKVIYGTNRIDSLLVNVEEGTNAIDYSASLLRYSQVGGQFELWNPSVKGIIRNDSISAYASLTDSLEEEQFALGANIYQRDSVTYLHMFPGLKFDYENWSVNPQNVIAFGPSGFYVNDFLMSKGDQAIQVNSDQPFIFNSPLKAAIQNFSLSNITRMLSRDTLLADGILNLRATADLRDSFPKIDANVSIDNLTAFEQPIGKLSATAHNESENTYNASLNLTENENDLAVSGRYFLTPVNGNNFDFVLDLKALSLKSLEGLSFGSIKNSSGFLRGNLNIKGTVDTPDIKGTLKTDNLQTTVTTANASFKMPSETIIFDKGGMNLDQFRILDMNGREATINGRVRTRNYVDYFLNLQFHSDKWQALNSTQKDNEMFYGKLFLSSDLNVKGYATAPRVDGNLTIHDSTKVTFAMQDTGPGMQESEGIVKFVDGRDTASLYAIDTVINQAKMRMSRAAQLNVNVGIEKNAVFNVIIDPLTGDNLSVSGEASLNTTIAPDGTVGLTGTYELNKGYYQLNYNFLKRRFDIQPGSVITLAGDPLEADVNITAAYNTSTAPYDLVSKQLTEDQLVYYKQRLPFQVLLKMKGKVMKPEITFDIVLPEDKATTVSTEVANNVQAKLNALRTNTSEMNKQVFALLILGRFISDDPFTSGTSTSAEFYARQSASRFLSQQLNQIAGQLVQGLDLAVDLESSEDYSTGQRQNKTDLNITASKRLFNDRLTITVGNDFQLEGQTAANKESSLIPGNLSADYRLTEDGRYLVRAYRKNQLQNVIDGYVVETGVSFKITLDYNKFKYIFRNRKKALERMNRQRQEEKQKEKETDDPAAVKQEGEKEEKE